MGDVPFAQEGRRPTHAEFAKLVVVGSQRRWKSSGRITGCLCRTDAGTEQSTAFDESLAARIRDAPARKKNIEEKKMFGGRGFLLTGNLLLAVRKDSLLLRLGPEQGEESLSEPHAGEFKITGRGAMTGWVVVSLEGVEDDDQLTKWIQRAVNFVTTLPAKQKHE